MNTITMKHRPQRLIGFTEMIDAEVYLEKLSLFGSILRKEGLCAGMAETEDAARILLDVGMENRETVKAALRTVYAGSRDEQIRFDRVFDSFFLPEDAIRALDRKHSAEEQKKREALEQAEKDLAQGGNFIKDFSQVQKEAYAMLPEEEKERLRDLRERFTGENSRNPELYTGFIHSVFAKSILEQQLLMEDAALGAQAVDPEAGLMFRDITEFQDKEIPKAVMYIQNLAAQINGELTKRRKSTGHSNVLDFRRTIRKGLETGGSLNRLKYRSRKSRRKQLVVLCDVSASMIRFSEFALRLIQALNQASESSRVILFSEDSKEADPFHLQNMDLFKDYVRESGVYGKGTNLGAALKKLNDEQPPAFSAATILLILSDSKTMDLALACSELGKVRTRAGKVICLNPIPESKWKYSSSVLTVAQYCTMVSCSTLNELGTACRRLALM